MLSSTMRPRKPRSRPVSRPRDEVAAREVLPRRPEASHRDDGHGLRDAGPGWREPGARSEASGGAPATGDAGADEAGAGLGRRRWRLPGRCAARRPRSRSPHPGWRRVRAGRRVRTGIEDGHDEAEQPEQEDAGQHDDQEPGRQLGAAGIAGRGAHPWRVASPRAGTARRLGQGDGLADPTGFEPAISSVTGWHVRPLHHGSREDGRVTGSDRTRVERRSLCSGLRCPTYRPSLGHRHAGPLPRCAGPWPRPRSAMTSSARTPPSTRSRSGPPS